ncbi:MAG: hypothetical protein OEX98_08035 [Nitrosopumilus sp.]|nr:hypothetical protein [Nitrosopumilus sp.]
MSTQTQSNDAYATYKQNVQKYFENISKITPQYFQAMTDLQKECMKTCEKTIDASISVQQEFAKKTGISTDLSTPTKTAITDASKQIVQASTVNNQFVKTTIDATVQNIKTYNDNVNAFVELNKNMAQLWVNPFTLKN